MADLQYLALETMRITRWALDFSDRLEIADSVEPNKLSQIATVTVVIITI